ncbi:MAG: tyrosine-type recombinase/integrase [Syntrophobacteraceae bacterium]
MQANTVRTKDAYFSVFLAMLGSRDFPSEDVTKTQIRDHIAGIQAKGGNKLGNRHLKELKALLRWGINQDLIRKNPAVTIEPFPEDPYVKYVPPAKDIDAVLLAADAEEGDLLLVLYHFGARIGEIIRLTWEDVNFVHRWVRLWARKRKRGQLEVDILPMSDKLYSVLEARWKKRNTESAYVFNRDGEKLTRDSDFIRHLMERLCERAQVKRFTSHSIQHHGASVLQDSGKATLKELQLFLRHRRQTTTENYLYQLDPRLARVVGVLDGSHKSQGGEQHETKNETTF